MKGFKSIKDGQRVALGRKLTFLVGPNSAGKSAVLLALQKLKGDKPEFILENSQIYRNPNKDSEISLVHSLGIEWESKGESLGYYSSYLPEGFDFFLEINNPTDLFNTTSIHDLDGTVTTDEFNNSSIRLVTSQHINGTPVVLTGGLTKPESTVEKNAVKLSLSLTNTIKMTQEGTKRLIINLSPLDTRIANKLTGPLKWLASEMDAYIKTDEAELARLESKEIKNNTRKNHVKNWPLESCKRILSDIQNDLRNNILSWDEEITRLILCGMFKGKRRQQILNIFEKNNALIKSYIKSIDIKLGSANNSTFP